MADHLPYFCSMTSMSYYEHITLIDSVKCVHIEVLRNLEAKGVLMNPGEYTSHIASYYKTLIGFLIGLFAIFTLGTI